MSAHGKTVALSNNSDTQTASSKADGGRESGLRKDGQLSKDGRFRWSAGWGQWVPTGKEINRPPVQQDFLAYEKPVSAHSPSCLCGACMTAGQRYADYLKARRLRDEF